MVILLIPLSRVYHILSKLPSIMVNAYEGAPIPKSWFVIGVLIVIMGASTSFLTIISKYAILPMLSFA